MKPEKLVAGCMWIVQTSELQTSRKWVCLALITYTEGLKMNNLRIQALGLNNSCTLSYGFETVLVS